MSSTNGLTVRKPKAVIFDIVCTVTKSDWIHNVIFPYVRDNVDTYLFNNWDKPVLMRDIDLLRAESLKDGGPTIPRPSETQERIRPAVVAYVKRCLAEVLNHEAIRIFSLHMTFDGYNRGKLETSMYSDAALCISNWTKDNIEIHVLSNGWSYAMKKFLSRTNHSDLSLVIKSYLDTELGPLEDCATYKTVVNKLGLPAEDILFLTHSGMKGVAAHQAGLSVILVATHREDLARERTDVTIQCGLPFVRIFTDLTFGNDAPVASSMVNERAMSQAVAASRVKGLSRHASGSKIAMSGASSKSGLSSAGGPKSSSAVGSSSKGSSSTASGSKSSFDAPSSKSSVASGSQFSGSHSSGSSSALSGSKPSSSLSGFKSKTSTCSSGSSSKGGSSSSNSKSGSKH